MLRALALSVSLVTSALAATPTPAVEVDVELVLAVDVSRSMSPRELELQRRGYAEALRSPEVARAVRGGAIGRIALTYVEWAGNQQIIVPWTLVANAEDLDAFAARLVVRPSRGMRRTSISDAIDHAARSLETNGFEGLRRVIDVSGDGPNNRGRPVEPARDDALAAGIVINGLPLLTGDGPYSAWDIPDLDDYYRRCVIGGPASFVVPVTRWEEFPQAVRQKLVQELVGLPVHHPVLRAQYNLAPEPPPYDCMIGERIWRERRGFTLP